MSIPSYMLMVGAFMGLGAFNLESAPASESSGTGDLATQRWFEVQTANFSFFSCGPYPEVVKLAGRLEQFRQAYALLAGAQAVVSPPIPTLVFPDDASFQAFKPRYEGQPANVSGYFDRGGDDNLIALNLANANASALEVVFHEYTHFLLRHNERLWPLWLTEGMADIYSAFMANGSRVRFGGPHEGHLRLLKTAPLMPLPDLFAVTLQSPQYNEQAQKHLFYSESWLLTQYLMLGDDLVIKNRFHQFTVLLRRGQPPVAAFTNALGMSFPALEERLRRYLSKGECASFEATLGAGISSAKAMAARNLTPAETCFRLGELLLRLNRIEDAEPFMLRAKSIAPESGYTWEGLGLLAARRGQSADAVRCFEEAIKRGMQTHTAYFRYGSELHRLTANPDGSYSPISDDAAAKIREALQKSIALMPSFAAAHKRLGFLELVQRTDLAAAEKHLRAAIQLEPADKENLQLLARINGVSPGKQEKFKRSIPTTNQKR